MSKRKFKKWDVVVVARKGDLDIWGWYDKQQRLNDNAIGTVETVLKANTCIVRHADTGTWLTYHESSLELLSDWQAKQQPSADTIRDSYSVLQKASGIKVGDTVKVLRTAQRGEMGWQAGWRAVMDRRVGTTGQVCELHNSYGVNVAFGDNYANWNFPFFALEKIKSAAPSNVVPNVNGKHGAVCNYDATYDYDADEVTIGRATIHRSKLERIIDRLNDPINVNGNIVMFHNNGIAFDDWGILRSKLEEIRRMVYAVREYHNAV